MIYTVCVCLFVLFAMMGLASVCYFFLVLFKKPRRHHQSVIVLPMDGDNRENARRIEYAFERVNLFGEDENVKIIALEPDGADISETERIFAQYNSISFAHLGDMPQVMSCLWDN